MWSITQLRLIPESPLPCAVAAEFGCAPDFPLAFFDAGPDLHAEIASNAITAAGRTPRLRNALLSVENAILFLLYHLASQAAQPVHRCYGANVFRVKPWLSPRLHMRGTAP
jgi:hypothetical protein